MTLVNKGHTLGGVWAETALRATPYTVPDTPYCINNRGPSTVLASG